MSEPDSAHGYVTDASYPDKFFRELSPTWLNYVAALNGAAPRDLTQPFTYLELGCAFGHAAIANAGAFPHADFHACDFNPEHAAGGASRAAAFGIANVQFHADSFAQLGTRDLPAFDFITLHGVYSWVDADARSAIRRLIAQRLKPGGLVYVSYNCLPGWANEVPLRKLLFELSATASGDSAARSQAGLHSLQQLAAAKLRYFSANPEAATAVEAYVKGPSNYLAHEFLNRTWEPFYSIDVADELAEIELTYVGSATLAENHQPLIVDERVAEEAAKLPTARQRQLAIDFATNQRFRRDVFVRGSVDLNPVQIAHNLHAQPIGALGSLARITSKARVPRGDIRFQDDFIAELRRLLASGSVTIADAVAALGGKGRDPTEIARNLIYLLAAGVLTPFARAYRCESTDRPHEFADTTVQRVFAYAIENDVARAVPSAVLGNGFEVSPQEAFAVTEFLAGNDIVTKATVELVQTLMRLQLVV